MRLICIRRSPKKLTIAILAIITIASGLYLFAPALPDDLSLPNSQLRLATWLGVTWSMDAHDPQQILALAHELTSHGVRDLYVYVSYLKADDTFNLSYDHAEDFVRQMKTLVPEMRLLAWIGVPVSQQLANGVTIDNRLASAEIRQAIADFSRFVVQRTRLRRCPLECGVGQQRRSDVSVDITGNPPEPAEPCHPFDNSPSSSVGFGANCTALSSCRASLVARLFS